MQDLHTPSQAPAEHISQYNFANNYLGDQWDTWGEAYADINMISPHLAERLKNRVEEKLSTTAKLSCQESTSTRRTSTDSCSSFNNEEKSELGNETHGQCCTGKHDDSSEDALIESRKHERPRDGPEASDDESNTHDSKHKRRRTSSSQGEETETSRDGVTVPDTKTERALQDSDKTSGEECEPEEKHITFTYGGYIMSLD
eukprot:comp7277_c0_seq1/m.2981 comp7277_c0_seq1/g.2981  ORF comp7277_c0_seq1/g.2981 comp7277_c0_seq1/m.2981 type:complete len:201 (-) comp7277_c0_seq1:535-1137(-)